jgi:hypothetical protein
MAGGESDNGSVTENDKDEIRRDELIGLHKHYESVAKHQLEFFFKYLNFYVVLFSGIIGGSIAGLLKISLDDGTGVQRTHHVAVILALGSLVVLPLARVA